jgi:hypothetical protein
MHGPAPRVVLPWLRLSGLNDSRLHQWANLAFPLFFGLLSLIFGQDGNWDLKNYHLYNPYALLNGKIGTDIAPAGLQSYFNPLLDIPFYLMTMHWPAMLAGFLMGALHGANVVLLLWIARLALPSLPREDRYRIPLLLAVAGAATVNFLSELGTSMGDDTTALFMLAAVGMVLHGWPWWRAMSWRDASRMALAGLVAGLGVGLKLTNAVHAVAICVGVLCVPAGAWTRFRFAFAFGCGVLAGMAITGGYWFVMMWQAFGNPLFPQFTDWFPHALATPGGIVDAKRAPHTAVDILLWPFLIALDSLRVAQIRLREITWPLFYVGMLGWLAAALSRRRPRTDDGGTGRFVIACVATGFVVWTFVFSIFRYTVVVEMLAPLATWLLLSRTLPYAYARRAGLVVLSLAALVVVLGGAGNWGRQAWAAKAVRVDSPALATPSNTTVILSGQNPPMAWIVPWLPADVAFASVNGGFPEGPDYAPRIRRTIDSRGGPVYGFAPGDAPDEAGNRASLDRVDSELARIAYKIDKPTCRTYDAFIGQQNFAYQFCRLRDIAM